MGVTSASITEPHGMAHIHTCCQNVVPHDAAVSQRDKMRAIIKERGRLLV